MGKWHESAADFERELMEKQARDKARAFNLRQKAAAMIREAEGIEATLPDPLAGVSTASET